MDTLLAGSSADYLRQRVLLIPKPYDLLLPVDSHSINGSKAVENEFGALQALFFSKLFILVKVWQSFSLNSSWVILSCPPYYYYYSKSSLSRLHSCIMPS